ncbi:helix-turn-helix domain-containing protein [Candidatus Woesearchaeota archaeon]|nr:helix-turn-helix domain-containing protein [Candidatus Woesearchaeota archaeon]
MDGNFIKAESQQYGMDLKYPLERYGLSEKETAVYLELLPMGSVKINEISKRLGYPRSTVYHILEYLINKGLVASIVNKGVTYYSAAEPEKLKDQLAEKQKLIDSILPQLKSLKAAIKEPSSVEIYEGFKGVHTILADLVRVKQQVYYFGGYKKSLAVLKHLPDYVRRSRMEKGIPAKMIYDYTDEPILHTKEYQKVSDLRFYDGFEDFPVMIFIYGQKVSMFSHKTDLVGIIIKNKDFAEAMRVIFEMYWGLAKPAKFKQDMRLSDIGKIR